MAFKDLTLKSLWRSRLRTFCEAALMVLVLLATPFARAGESASECEHTYTPAPAGLDFTSLVNRWGHNGKSPDLAHIDGKEIDRVYINRLPIFDTDNPREDRRLYRWANRVHSETRESVIRKLLLFRDGDIADGDTLAESERILRDQKYLGDAVIQVASECGDRVDLEVVTREVWTLVPEVSLHLSGGSSKTRVGLRDSNFLGTGKRVSLIELHDSDRNSLMLHYTDVNVGGNHKLLRTNFAESSDGYDRLLQFMLPFYSLNSERSWGVILHQNERVDHQYENGREKSAVTTDDDFADLHYGISSGIQNGAAHRLSYGMRYHSLRYSESGDPAPAPWPRDMRFIYPYVQYQQIEDRYTKVFNLNQMYQIEDLHLGVSLRASLGYAPGTDRAFLFDGELSDTFISKEKMLLVGSANWEGRLRGDTHRVEDGVLGLSLRYYRGQTPSRSLFVGLGADAMLNPTPVNQLVLGGETGLRGYPNHFQSGDARYLLTIEERNFTRYQILNLVHIGYAFFVDAGSAYTRSGRDAGRETLTSAGIGLRFAPSKSTKGQVIHVDISFPMSRRGEVDSYQISAQLKETI